MLKQVYKPNHEHIGTFDGEFVYIDGELCYRLDGDEVYSMSPHRYVGSLKGVEVRSLDGKVLFYFES